MNSLSLFIALVSQIALMCWTSASTLQFLTLSLKSLRVERLGHHCGSIAAGIENLRVASLILDSHINNKSLSTSQYTQIIQRDFRQRFTNAVDCSQAQFNLYDQSVGRGQLPNIHYRLQESK